MDAKNEFDEKDLQILLALQKNARMKNKDLAAEVGLAASTTLFRTQRLEKLGVIRGFHADIDPAALGHELEALISVRLKQHTAEDVGAFRAYVMTLPEVVRLYHVAGEKDFLLHVGVKNSDALREFAMTALTTRREVAHLETGLIYECKDTLTR